MTLALRDKALRWKTHDEVRHYMDLQSTQNNGLYPKIMGIQAKALGILEVQVVDMARQPSGSLQAPRPARRESAAAQTRTSRWERATVGLGMEM